jgi:hypothetical protein
MLGRMMNIIDKNNYSDNTTIAPTLFLITTMIDSKLTYAVI